MEYIAPLLLLIGVAYPITVNIVTFKPKFLPSKEVLVLWGFLTAFYITFIIFLSHPDLFEDKGWVVLLATYTGFFGALSYLTLVHASKMFPITGRTVTALWGVASLYYIWVNVSYPTVIIGIPSVILIMCATLSNRETKFMRRLLFTCISLTMLTISVIEFFRLFSSLAIEEASISYVGMGVVFYYGLASLLFLVLRTWRDTTTIPVHDQNVRLNVNELTLHRFTTNVSKGKRALLVCAGGSVLFLNAFFDFVQPVTVVAVFYIILTVVPLYSTPVTIKT